MDRGALNDTLKGCGRNRFVALYIGDKGCQIIIDEGGQRLF